MVPFSESLDPKNAMDRDLSVGANSGSSKGSAPLSLDDRYEAENISLKQKIWRENFYAVGFTEPTWVEEYEKYRKNMRKECCDAAGDSDGLPCICCSAAVCSLIGAGRVGNMAVLKQSTEWVEEEEDPGDGSEPVIRRFTRPRLDIVVGPVSAYDRNERVFDTPIAPSTRFGNSKQVRVIFYAVSHNIFISCVPVLQYWPMLICVTYPLILGLSGVTLFTAWGNSLGPELWHPHVWFFCLTSLTLRGFCWFRWNTVAFSIPTLAYCPRVFANSRIWFRRFSIPSKPFFIQFVWAVLTLGLIFALAMTAFRDPGILPRYENPPPQSENAWRWSDRALSYRPRGAFYDSDTAVIVEGFDHTWVNFTIPTFPMLFGHFTWSCCILLLLVTFHFGKTSMHPDHLSDSSRTSKLPFASIQTQRCTCIVVLGPARQLGRKIWTHSGSLWLWFLCVLCLTSYYLQMDYVNLSNTPVHVRCFWAGTCIGRKNKGSFHLFLFCLYPLLIMDTMFIAQYWRSL